jgi:hypothetical protein
MFTPKNKQTNKQTQEIFSHKKEGSQTQSTKNLTRVKSKYNGVFSFARPILSLGN